MTLETPRASTGPGSRPHPPQDDELRTARTVRLTTSLLLAAAVSTLAINEILLGRTDLRVVVAVAGVALAGARWLAWRRRHGAAAVLTAVTLLASVTTAIVSGGLGIHDVSIVVFPGVIVMAALLLGRAGFLTLTALTILTAVGIVIAEMAGAIVTPMRAHTSYDDIAVMLIFLGLTGILARTMAEDLRAGLVARRDAEHELERSNELLSVIARAQQRLIERRDPRSIFADLLTDTLTLTRSEYGFIAEVLTTPEGRPYLRAFVLTDVSWSAETRARYEQQAAVGMEFGNLETLFGAALTSGRPVIANDAEHDPRRGGLPAGHPPLRTFLGLPFRSGDRLVGMVGLANRPGGYDDVLVEYLHPLLATCANMLDATHVDRERRASEAERVRLEAQVQYAQKLESLGVLAGGIAHDFNNLLMVILGNLDLALFELPQGAPAHDRLMDAKEAGRRASELTRQMLAYSGRGTFVVHRVNLSRLIDEMTPMLRLSVSKKAELRFALSPDLPPIEADATQIRQVALNLVVNASEAIGDRSGIIEVSTRAVDCDAAMLVAAVVNEAAAPGPHVCLDVTDNGGGMDPETQARIFDPFFTTKVSGRGLGLAAVMGIVRGHRGAIAVRSRPDGGTTFSVLFPQAGQAHAAAPADAGSAASVRGTGTILLVDDEAAVRSTAKAMLERLGYRVVLAEDGRQAVEKFQAHQAAIAGVLLDLTMPSMDGEETCRALRRIDARVRVVLSSGYGEHDVEQRFAGLGLAGFIQKPYELNSLGTVLASALRD
jgi:signal transduction histidine kinase/CheY-like chemotaxis protein